MNPYDTRKRAVEYIFMADGYDGRALVGLLHGYLRPGSAVLEIGMGPGKDIALLKENYHVTGSDISPAFLELYREKNPGSDLILLDAVTLETERKFNCIYSNKVLHYLDPDQLKASLIRQYEVLTPGGLLCHSFWYGEKEIEVKGMKFHYYSDRMVRECLDDKFEVIVSKKYREMDLDDSLFMLMRRSGPHVDKK